MQQDLFEQHLLGISRLCLWVLPFLLLLTGLLMVSAIRYPHLVNRYLRGRRSIARLLFTLALLLLLVIAHRYTLGFGTLLYSLSGPFSSGYLRMRRRAAASASAKMLNKHQA